MVTIDFFTRLDLGDKIVTIVIFTRLNLGERIVTIQNILPGLIWGIRL